MRKLDNTVHTKSLLAIHNQFAEKELKTWKKGREDLIERIEALPNFDAAQIDWDTADKSNMSVVQRAKANSSSKDDKKQAPKKEAEKKERNKKELPKGPEGIVTRPIPSEGTISKTTMDLMCEMTKEDGSLPSYEEINDEVLSRHPGSVSTVKCIRFFASKLGKGYFGITYQNKYLNHRKKKSESK